MDKFKRLFLKESFIEANYISWKKAILRKPFIIYPLKGTCPLHIYFGKHWKNELQWIFCKWTRSSPNEETFTKSKNARYLKFKFSRNYHLRMFPPTAQRYDGDFDFSSLFLQRWQFDVIKASQKGPINFNNIDAVRISRLNEKNHFASLTAFRSVSKWRKSTFSFLLRLKIV